MSERSHQRTAARVGEGRGGRAAALCGLAMLGAALGASGAGSGTEKLLTRGDRWLAAGQPQRALDAYREADELADGSSFAAAAALARGYLVFHDHDAALESVVRALRLAADDPDRAAAWELLGSVHLDRGRWLEGAALEPTFRDPESEPRRPVAPGEGAGAIAAEEGITAWHDPEAGRLRRAARDSLDRAERAFRRALETAGHNHHRARLGLAEALVLVERRGEAREVLEPLLDAPAEGGPTPKARERTECLVAMAAPGPRTGSPLESVQDPAFEWPVRLAGPSPSFPPAAPDAGHVVLRSLIDASGRVVCSLVLASSTPLFEEPSLEAVGDWSYQPAKLDGRPVAAHYTTKIRFRRESD